MFSKINLTVLIIGIYFYSVKGQTNASVTNTTKQCGEAGAYCQYHWDCCSNSCLTFSYKCVKNNQQASVPISNPVLIQASAPQAGVPLSNRFGTNTGTGTGTAAASPPRQCKEIDGYCQNHWDCCSNSCLSFGNRCIRNFDSPNQPNPPIVQSSQDLSNRFGNNNAPSLGSVIYYPQGPLYGEQPILVNSLEELINRFAATFENDNKQNTLTNRLGEEDVPVTTQRQCLSVGQSCVNTPDCCSLNCAYKVCAAGYNIVNGAELSNGSPCLPNGGKCSRGDQCCTGRCHGYLKQCVT